MKVFERDLIGEALGCTPNIELVQELHEEFLEFKKLNKPQRWAGWGPGHGRPKGSKNVNPYPKTKAVKQRIQNHGAFIGARNIGRVWVTDGVTSKFVHQEQIPEGWNRGRIMKNSRLNRGS